MNIQEIIKNPELLNGLSNTDKTKVYMQLNNLKNEVNNKLAGYKAKKDLLEKQKQDLQEELLKDAGVNNMESLIAYVSELQNEFDVSLKHQIVELGDVIDKLKI